MRRILGAPLGGTTVGGQYGLESLASILMVPPNGAAEVEGTCRLLSSSHRVNPARPWFVEREPKGWRPLFDRAYPQKPKPAFSDAEHLTVFPTFLRFDPERTPGG